MPKFLGVCVLAIAIFCGLAFEGRPSLAPSRATTAPRSVGGPAEVRNAPGGDLESIDVALIGEAVKQVEAHTCYNDRLSDGKPNPCTV
jgi:hypothetical protein